MALNDLQSYANSVAKNCILHAQSFVHNQMGYFHNNFLDQPKSANQKLQILLFNNVRSYKLCRQYRL